MQQDDANSGRSGNRQGSQANQADQSADIGKNKGLNPSR